MTLKYFDTVSNLLFQHLTLFYMYKQYCDNIPVIISNYLFVALNLY